MNGEAKRAIADECDREDIEKLLEVMKDLCEKLEYLIEILE